MCTGWSVRSRRCRLPRCLPTRATSRRSAPSCVPSSGRPTASTCSARSSAGTASGCWRSSSRAPRRGSRSGSSRPRTSGPPNSGPSTRSSPLGAQVRSATRRATRLHAKAWLFHRELRLRHRVRRQQQPLALGAGRRARVERPALGGRTPDSCASSRARSTATGPTRVRGLRPGPTPSARRLRRALGRDRIGRIDRPVRAGGPAATAPGADPRRAGVRAGAPRPPPQPRRRGHRHGQDGGRRARLRAGCGRRCPRDRLLFVAHRQRDPGAVARTYREVLADGAFGENLRRRRAARALAARVRASSRCGYGVERLPPDHFDVVVVDEFHHAEAPTYRRLLDHLHPRELLGLTATPERADGADVRELFGGRIAYELRLWDALERGPARAVPLLRRRRRRRPAGHRVEARRLRHGGARRASTRATTRGRRGPRGARDKVTDLRRMRALGFCVRWPTPSSWPTLHRAGIPALAVTGGPRDRRAERAARVCAPARSTCCSPSTCSTRASTSPRSTRCCSSGPTESATVFLQQLGRGLRRARGKSVLTVLDFVGQHRRGSASTSATGRCRRQPRGLLERQIERGFPFLPAGCHLGSTASQRSCSRTCAQQLRVGDRGRWWPTSERTGTCQLVRLPSRSRAPSRQTSTRQYRVVDRPAARGRAAPPLRAGTRTRRPAAEEGS